MRFVDPLPITTLLHKVNDLRAMGILISITSQNLAGTTIILSWSI
ncbi:MAG: hypothetical protein R2880_17465 [Deinococcales bacterium]